MAHDLGLKMISGGGAAFYKQENKTTIQTHQSEI